MKLSKSADFALRTVIYLAQNHGANPMPVLSEVLHIPYNNLIKIVQKLRYADVVAAKQGKSGGVFLKQSPDSITIRQIVDVIDGPTRLSECLANEQFCKLSSCCVLQGVLATLQSNINGMLETVTIGSILEKSKKKETAYV